MKHQIELTTIELMIIRELLSKKHFKNDADCLVASEIMDKIDNTVKRDLPKAEHIKEKKNEY